MTKKLFITIYFASLTLFSFWSWFLVDPNLNMWSGESWTVFRNFVVNIGYHARPLSHNIWLVACVGMTLGFAIINRFKFTSREILAIALAIVALCFVSYPSLSHDFFNYIFDARIFTEYGKNPYLYKALDFPGDPMTRFMHWTHRTYPYGPAFLVLTIIPSFLGMGKFILTYLLFKLLWCGAYLMAVLALSRKSPKIALFFATCPLVFVEGLVNMHNDFLMLALVLWAIVALGKKYYYKNAIIIVAALIKYFVAPILVVELVKNEQIRKYLKVFAFVWLLLLVLYVGSKNSFHPWYFLNLLVFLPYFENLYYNLQIAMFGLLLSYSPYVLHGEWGAGGSVSDKQAIVVGAVALNVAFLIVRLSLEKMSKTRAHLKTK